MEKLYEHDKIPFQVNDARKALTELLKNKEQGRSFNIFTGDFKAGYIIITFGYSIEFKGKDAFIDEIFIDEKFRGKGLGPKVLKFAEKICRDSGVRALHLEVERENLKAQNAYRKSGLQNGFNYCY